MIRVTDLKSCLKKWSESLITMFQIRVWKKNVTLQEEFKIFRISKKKGKSKNWPNFWKYLANFNFFSSTVFFYKQILVRIEDLRICRSLKIWFGSQISDHCSRSDPNHRSRIKKRSKYDPRITFSTDHAHSWWGWGRIFSCYNVLMGKCLKQKLFIIQFSIKKVLSLSLLSPTGTELGGFKKWLFSSILGCPS